MPEKVDFADKNKNMYLIGKQHIITMSISTWCVIDINVYYKEKMALIKKKSFLGLRRSITLCKIFAEWFIYIVTTLPSFLKRQNPLIKLRSV